MNFEPKVEANMGKAGVKGEPELIERAVALELIGRDDCYGGRTSRSSLSLVMLEEAAESLVADDVAFGRRFTHGEGNVSHALMRPLFKVMSQVLTDEVAQVTLAEDDEVIEAFRLDREDPTLGVSVEVRCSRADWDRLNVLGRKGGVKLCRELSVQIVDQMGWSASQPRGQAKESLRLLGDPASVGMCCHAGDHDPARADMAKEQDVEVNQPLHGPERQERRGT